MRRFEATILVCAAAALAAAACASASSVFVLEGRGWGHGVGMSQWGAYGYARHGWPYPRILAHYYRGTRLAAAAPERVRVLLARGRSQLDVGCAGPIHVADASGRGYRLPRGTYRLGRRLWLPAGRRRGRAVKRPLRPPLVFDCPSAPLSLGGADYRGRIVVRRTGRRLAAVNSVSLENYLRGVVGGEMPSHWSIAALEAQAVAARSYALATLKPRRAFDLFADARSQVYGGRAYESPRVDRAVARTAGRILTWQGHPAATFFFSTSGGRTASIHDVWPRAQDLPYLRSVADPYDGVSPHHRWGPVAVTPAELAARLHAPALRRADSLRVVRSRSGRAAVLELAGRRIGADQFRRAAGLQSTWFDVGTLTLHARRVVLRGRADDLGRAELQARTEAGRWHRIRSVGPGSFEVRVRPGTYRLASFGIAVSPVRVDAGAESSRRSATSR
ncbi:MAG: SpoIID/LytB domain-containing protein [Gaiellaceae bacterium]